jgi:hypothetical protein
VKTYYEHAAGYEAHWDAMQDQRDDAEHAYEELMEIEVKNIYDDDGDLASVLDDVLADLAASDILEAIRREDCAYIGGVICHRVQQRAEQLADDRIC